MRALWNRGLASEAARRLRDHGFDRLGCERLISLIVPGNHASQRVAVKIGMSLDRETTWRGTRVRVYAIRRTDGEDGDR